MLVFAIIAGASLIIVLAFGCSLLHEVVLMRLRRREAERQIHEKAARFAQPSAMRADGEPQVGRIKSTSPQIETSFEDNERIGKL